MNHTITISRTIRLFGIAESTMKDVLQEIIANYTNPTIIPEASDEECSIRIVATADSAEMCYQMMEAPLRGIKKRLGFYIYGIDVENLQEALVSYLVSHQIHVATAESCTGGMISKCITDIAGSSAIYPGGVCTYSNDMKQKMLGVSAETLEQYGAVSESCAKEMAEGIRKFTGADIGISSTGVAGPDTSEGKAVGTVYIGIASSEGTVVQQISMEYQIPPSRDSIRKRSTKHALYALLQAAKNLCEV